MPVLPISKGTYRNIVTVSNFLRIITPPFILFYPVTTTIIIFILDAVDGEFYKRSEYPRSVYSMYDKGLDYYGYLWVVAYVVIHPFPVKSLFLLLFFYRSIGQFMYIWKRIDAYLFFFPNVFEFLFFIYIIGKYSENISLLLEPPIVYLVLTILIPLVLMREYAIHIKRANFSYIWGRKTRWIDEKAKE